ncbi:MAG: hypothetical protein WCO35_01055 [Candidatus Nomurabacteria bacterium]
MEEIGSNIQKKENQKSIRERIYFPHIDAITKAWEKHFGTIEQFEFHAIREILYTYIEQRIDKTSIYNSEKIGASFVYSITDPGELAKNIYSKITNGKILDLKKNITENSKKEKEFMFIGGLVGTSSGNEYASQEEVLHRMIEELPRAFEDIKNGVEPKQKEIYTLGSPTNELGEISDRFIYSLKDKKASEEFGMLYADFISNLLAKEVDNDKTTNIYFNGISMGAGFAIETAKELKKENFITQIHEEINKPFLQVQINTPPGQSDPLTKFKKIKIKAGFVLQVLYSMVNDPYMRDVMMQDRKFLSSKNKILSDRGIVLNMSPEQKNKKEKVISEVVQDLVDGVFIPNDLKITEIIGKSDPLMYSSKFNDKLKEQRNRFTERRDIEGESLGENIVSNDNEPNRRTFGIGTNHSIPFLRPSEFQRLKKVVNLIQELKTELNNK